MMKAFVTGVGGQLGHDVMNELAKRGYEAVGSDILDKADSAYPYVQLDNKHLKLLYCIDALNEGVHVPDVSGVILLRPTISPIIYKQQIGRALSASKSKNLSFSILLTTIHNLRNRKILLNDHNACI